MKPKIFIGSSVEGLNVAYAVQQNLTHDAESTVWDQGLFELSKTTIETLENSLETTDFGIFVLSDDDISIMRDKKSSVVRDNVLFELGLFIGKLGRERVFFIIPDDTSLHIPTDLLGITPGKYNPNREDGSLQAATGAVSNSIRIQIKKLGLLRENDNLGDSSDSSDEKQVSKQIWIDDFVSDNFLDAKEKLTTIMLEKKGDDLLRDEVWMSYINFKINEKEGLIELERLITKHVSNEKVVPQIMDVFLWEDYVEKAIELGETSLEKVESKNKILIKLGDCYKKNGDLVKALDLLKNFDPSNNPDITIALAEITEVKSEALLILHAAYQNFPNHEDLVYAFAKLLHEKEYYKEALYLHNFLINKDSESSTYCVLLGNACLSLNLNDKAMKYYKKAEEIAESPEPWIFQNIGNLLKNRGFYSEAIKSLKKGLELDDESEYAHDRLANSIKSKDEEHEKYTKQCKEGRKLIRDFGSNNEVEV